MKAVRLSALAQDELREAFQHLDENAGPDIADRFILSVNSTLEAVADRPESFVVVHAEAMIRRAITHRFPYGVFFQVDDDEIRVIAVTHLRRHPDTWKRRTD